MSKESRARIGSEVAAEESSSAPYSTRREKSRKLAQRRRDTYKQIMDDLTNVLPFPKEAVSQLDYNSRLRLALCFFRLKTMVETNSETPTTADTQTTLDSGMQIVKKKFVSDNKPALFQPGMLQDLMSEALDGFLMVTQVDGTIVFLSESIHKHMGLFQSEHIGVNMFELIHEEDNADVRSKISEAEMKSLNDKNAAKVTFFCRMKCSRYKVANVITKSPGYKLVYISGTIKRARGEPFIACVVRPVSPPSVLEIRLEGNMFVCRYGVDFTCTYFDGRLRPLLGYDKDDLIGKQPFDLFHHEDIAAIVKCRNKVFEKGESLSGYYRFFNAHGQSIWLQTRATLIIDSRTGKPVCVNCMFFVISKEDGDRDLQMRLAIENGESSIKEENIHSHDPFPVIERSDGTVVNPLHDDKVPSPSSSSTSVKSPTDLSAEDENSPSTSGNDGILSPDSSDIPPEHASPPVVSSSRLGQGQSLSSLHSTSPIDSGTGISPSPATHHGSSSSLSSGVISSGDSVFIDRSSPQELTGSTNTARSQSVSPDKIDSCLPDSTTSNLSSPFNTHQNNGKFNLSGRSTSGDLGYRSGSDSSSPIRDRLVSGVSSYGSSPLIRTNSNTSSIVSDNPLSANSSMHSIGGLAPQANTPASVSISSPEVHSQSPFHATGGLGSSTVMQAPNPIMSDSLPSSSYQSVPAALYGSGGGIQYVQDQPINSNGFPLPLDTGLQYGAPLPFGGQMNVGNSVTTAQPFHTPQSHLAATSVSGGVDLLNSLPDWVPGSSRGGLNNFATPSSTTAASSSMSVGYPNVINGAPPAPGGNVPPLQMPPSSQMVNLQSNGGPGFELIEATVPLAAVNSAIPQEFYDPPPVVTTGPNMFVGSSMVQGHPSNSAPSFQAPPTDSRHPLCNGGHSMAPPTAPPTASDLPQLTIDDLKILDTFGPIQREGHFGQFPYQQPTLNGHAMV